MVSNVLTKMASTVAPGRPIQFDLCNDITKILEKVASSNPPELVIVGPGVHQATGKMKIGNITACFKIRNCASEIPILVVPDRRQLLDEKLMQSLGARILDPNGLPARIAELVFAQISSGRNAAASEEELHMQAFIEAMYSFGPTEELESSPKKALWEQFARRGALETHKAIIDQHMEGHYITAEMVFMRDIASYFIDGGVRQIVDLGSAAGTLLRRYIKRALAPSICKRDQPTHCFSVDFEENMLLAAWLGYQRLLVRSNYQLSGHLVPHCLWGDILHLTPDILRQNDFRNGVPTWLVLSYLVHWVGKDQLVPWLVDFTRLLGPRTPLKVLLVDEQDANHRQVLSPDAVTAENPELFDEMARLIIPTDVRDYYGDLIAAGFRTVETNVQPNFQEGHGTPIVDVSVPHDLWVTLMEPTPKLYADLVVSVPKVPIRSKP